MKKIMLVTKLVLALLLFICRIADAQIRNASFEDRNHAPRTRSNIGPVSSSHAYPDADLPETDWYHPGVSTGPYIGFPPEDSPDYIAADGAYLVNPVTDIPTIYGPGYSGFSARTGISCIQIGGPSGTTPGSRQNDEFITQELTQALTPGHLYHAEFWALRIPGPSSRAKLALSITDGNPIYDHNNNTLLPSPGNKVIVSGDIQQRYVWTKVEGNIVIPASGNNKWVTIGYARSNDYYDPSAQDDYPVAGGLFFAIDDVSLMDMGCYVADPQVQTPDWPCEYGPGPIKAYIDNYDPDATYTITTTNNIRNSPFPNSIFYNQTPGNPGWFFYLRSVREGATGLVTVTVSKNGCTGTTTFNITSPEAGCGGGPTESAVGYPNPATDRVQAPVGAEQAVLLDSRGKPVQKADASGKLDVQSLPDGLYNLQMRQNGKLINQRIQVKH